MLSNNVIGGFDPFGWLEKWIPSHHVHLLIRLGVMAVSITFLVHCIARYRDFLVKPLWAIEALVFVAFLISYAVRTEPLERSKGIREIVVPLVGAVMPFALLLTPPSPWTAHNTEPLERSKGIREIVVPLVGAVMPFALLLTPPSPWTAHNMVVLHAVFYWMAAATSLTLWGIWTLRRSFSITVEVRALVTNGPYRWLRHPIYVGEILAAAGVLAWRFSVQNLAIFLIFVQIQVLRARWEEDKLKKFFRT